MEQMNKFCGANPYAPTFSTLAHDHMNPRIPFGLTKAIDNKKPSLVLQWNWSLWREQRTMTTIDTALERTKDGIERAKL